MPRKRKPKGEPPTCNCIMLCDDVTVSMGRNKHSLIGLINAIGVPELPAVIGGYMVYVRGSNVYGRQKIRLVLEYADTEEEVLAIEGQFSEESQPLSVYTLMLQLPPFTVQREGRYIFSAKHDGVPIAQMPLQIRLIGPNAGE